MHLLLRLLHQNLVALKRFTGSRGLPERDNPKLTETLKGLREIFIEGAVRDIDRPLDREEQRRHKW